MRACVCVASELWLEANTQNILLLLCNRIHDTVYNVMTAQNMATKMNHKNASS